MKGINWIGVFSGIALLITYFSLPDNQHALGSMVLMGTVYTTSFVLRK